MKTRLKKFFSRKRNVSKTGGSEDFRVERKIKDDIEKVKPSRAPSKLRRSRTRKSPAETTRNLEKPTILKHKKDVIQSRTLLEKFAYDRISSHLPTLSGYKEVYEQAGIPRIYESYLSSAFLLSFVVFFPFFLVSLIIELFALRISFELAILGSSILGGIGFAVSLALWLFYPLQRRDNYKNKLESQLAYSFGILGVLAAAGLTLDRMFEGISTSETNPVLAGLARRFLRNVRIFGMDIEAALREVADHSPSLAFSRMLESVSVAFKTTGSLHNLIMFESGRLFTEKREKLKKGVSSLAVMAELYITLVVVGPIIFIVMLAIFLFLPSGGSHSLPDPTLLINILIFIGIPAVSAMFVLLLDSMIAKV